ncbi:MAG TPA: DUF1573 domain-containing protein [Pirellulales bacterium]|nr:DUF1573 domain-containing protein [Pirellulales bacterium]
MQRHLLSALLLVLLGSSAGMAEDWARKMFTESSHDFGTVARDAKVEYRFQFANPYQETVHVAGVSSSCGCTTPEVTKSDLKTYEKSEIVAKFNTRSFTGNHQATITVTFDKPFYATVQFVVFGDIRGELQLQPEQVELGTIDQGQEVERRVTVNHYGSSDWKILDVRSVNSNYEVEVKDGSRSYDKVSYDLVVHLKKDAPPGYLKDQLVLVTNDPRITQFPVEVEGLVKAELSASPQSLALGLVEVGKTATKPIVVRGRRPFMVTAVHCDDDAFTFKVPTAAGAVQFILVTFTAPDKAGKIAKKIRIETDLGKSFVVEVVAQAEVKGVEHPADVAPNKTDTAADKTAADKPATGNKATADKTGNDKPVSEKAGADQKPSSPSVQPATASPAIPSRGNPFRASSTSTKSGI